MMRRLLPALVLLLAASGARATSTPILVTATATVNALIQMTHVTDLDCGEVDYSTTQCGPSPGYQPGAVLVKSNVDWLLSTSDNGTPIGVSTPQGDFVTVADLNGDLFFISYQTSQVTGSATSGTTVTFVPSTTHGLNVTKPPGLYTGSFTVTIAYIP
jgi:hypothetical protein